MTKEKAYVLRKTEEKQQELFDKVSYFKDKYQKIGVYCIKCNGEVVYIGSAKDMSFRIAAHCFHLDNDMFDCEKDEYKYRLLRKAIRGGCSISFDVLDYCDDILDKLKPENYLAFGEATEEDEKEQFEKVIGRREKEWIGHMRPALNTKHKDYFGLGENKIDRDLFWAIVNKDN